MDPYKVLGVTQTASDADIKKAYRDLVKKYHPDKYTDTDMAELANEKLKQINAAYADIQKIRSGKGSSSGGYSARPGGAGYSSANYSAGYSPSPKYQQVFNFITVNNVTAAESELNRIEERDAEWYYLMGLVLLRRNWYDGARQHFGRAVQMEPSNATYQQAFNSVGNMGGYRNFYGNGQGGQGSQCSVCDICAGLMCVDCLCGCCTV